MKFKSIHVSDNSGKTASPAIALPSTQMYSDTFKCILVDGYALIRDVAAVDVVMRWCDYSLCKYLLPVKSDAFEFRISESNPTNLHGRQI